MLEGILRGILDCGRFTFKMNVGAFRKVDFAAMKKQANKKWEIA